MSDKVRMGMVGGGSGSFIGAIHRMAARLDGRIELTAGCFSQDESRSRKAGEQLDLSPERIYADYQTMMTSELALPEGQRIEFVAIVTPNHLHVPIALCAIEHGFHVLCDKPIATDLESALTLKESVNRSSILFGLSQTYAAYPMVMQARELVGASAIGDVRRVTVTYRQGWLSRPEDTESSAQAQWRTDPQRSGESGCFGDIGTHAYHLAEFVSGLEVRSVCADLITVVEGRDLDDDGAVLLRLEDGAKGTLIASQVCAGEANNLCISISGSAGTLAWQHDKPNELVLKKTGDPVRVFKAGDNCEYLSNSIRSYCRTPEGHPEGYIEAFANIYRDFAEVIRERMDADKASFASIDEGIRAMQFVRAVIKSSRGNASWESLGRN